MRLPDLALTSLDSTHFRLRVSKPEMRSCGVKQLATSGSFRSLSSWAGDWGGCKDRGATGLCSEAQGCSRANAGRGILHGKGGVQPSVGELMGHTGLPVAVCTCSGRGLEGGTPMAAVLLVTSTGQGGHGGSPGKVSSGLASDPCYSAKRW